MTYDTSFNQVLTITQLYLRQFLVPYSYLLTGVKVTQFAALLNHNMNYAIVTTGRRMIFYAQLGCQNSDHPTDPNLYSID